MARRYLTPALQAASSGLQCRLFIRDPVVGETAIS